MPDPSTETDPYDLAPAPVEPVAGEPNTTVLPYASAPKSVRKPVEQTVGSNWRNYFLPGVIALAGSVATLITQGLAFGPFVLAGWVSFCAFIILLSARWVDLDLGVLTSASIRIVSLGCALAGTGGLVLLAGAYAVLLYVPIMTVTTALTMRLLFDAEMRAVCFCAPMLIGIGGIVWFGVYYYFG